MDVKKEAFVTLIMSGHEAQRISEALYEALWYTSRPQADGYSVNWRSDPNDLRSLYALLVQREMPSL